MSNGGFSLNITPNPVNAKKKSGKTFTAVFTKGKTRGRPTCFTYVFHHENMVYGWAVHGFSPDLSHHPLKGAMIETYAAQNLRRILDASWPQAQLCFWNIHGRHEVDFIIEAKNRCIAIEIKAATRWDKNDLTGLNAFPAATKECTAGILACNTPAADKLGERLCAILLSLLLS
jgi:hypothetical protein